MTHQSGESALAEVSENIAVIICDMIMPGMNGITLLEQIKKKTPDAERILLTGSPNLEVALEAIQNGTAHRYVTKPWATEKLFNTIKILMEKWQEKIPD